MPGSSTSSTGASWSPPGARSWEFPVQSPARRDKPLSAKHECFRPVVRITFWAHAPDLQALNDLEPAGPQLFLQVHDCQDLWRWCSWLQDFHRGSLDVVHENRSLYRWTRNEMYAPLLLWLLTWDRCDWLQRLRVEALGYCQTRRCVRSWTITLLWIASEIP